MFKLYKRFIWFKIWWRILCLVIKICFVDLFFMIFCKMVFVFCIVMVSRFILLDVIIIFVMVFECFCLNCFIYWLWVLFISDFIFLIFVLVFEKIVCFLFWRCVVIFLYFFRIWLSFFKKFLKYVGVIWLLNLLRLDVIFLMVFIFL